jgi:hypothetical protein
MGGRIGRCIAGLASARPEPAMALARPPEGCILRFDFADFWDEAESRRCHPLFPVSLECEGGEPVVKECPSSEVGEATKACCPVGGGESTMGILWPYSEPDELESEGSVSEIWDDPRSGVAEGGRLVSERAAGSSGSGRVGLGRVVLGVRSSGSRSPASGCVPKDSARRFPSFMRSANTLRAFPSPSSGYSEWLRRCCSAAAAAVESSNARESGRCKLPGDGGGCSRDSFESDVKTRRGLLWEGATLVTALR